MKTHHPTTHPRRKRRPADEAAAPMAEHDEAVSPAQSLETLRNPALGAAERGRVTLGLQRAVGNAAVGREVAQRQTVPGGAPNQAKQKAKKRSRQQAEAMVPAHVEPKACFVWFLGSKVGWGSIRGTGCAHWVAHQLGITRGAKCTDGFSIRVPDVIAGRARFPLAQAHVGDIWEDPSDHSHVGIVREVRTDPKTHKVIQVLVEHDSFRQGGVVTSWFSDGDFYR
jgi:hypothetical protein